MSFRIGFIAAAVAVSACADISGGKNDILSVKFDTLAFPSVVLGDSLRDSTGTVALPRVTAFNFQGDVIASPVVRYRSPDRGVTVDSLTGLIIGDSLRSTPARIIAAVGPIQVQQPLAVTSRPDSVAAANARDTITYSLLDTALNVSKAVSVKVLHGAAADSTVGSWLVSFAIISPASAQLADLVDDGGTRKSRVDTTDASGVAGRRIRLHATALSSPTVIDSIVINATAKYRGTNVKGSPVRLIVLLKPK